MCRSAYRSPPEATEQVLAVMEDNGWRVCRCTHQSDVCIASHVHEAPDKSTIRVVTHDSDLLAYEDIHSITIPAGVSKDWTTYYKDELLNELDLPSPAHLVLVAMVTGNDYTRGVPHYGLASNTAIVRQFDLGVLSSKTGQDLVEGYQKFVGDYLDLVKAKAEDNRRSAGQRQQQRLQRRAKQIRRQTPPPESKAERKDLNRIDRADLQLAMTVSDFQGATRAFVSCQESPQSTQGSRPPPAYDAVRSTLLELELRKARINSSRAKRIGAAAEARDALLGAVGVMDESEQSAPIIPAASAGQQSFLDSGCGGKAKRKRTRKARKHRGPRKSRSNRRRLQTWRKSMFRRRTDLARPYEPHEVFLPDASPVEEDALPHLKPSTPRPYKPKPNSSSNNSDGNSKNKNKKKGKKKPLELPADKEGPKALKKSFGGAFKTVVLTAGSLSGCLRRATDLTSEEIAQVVNRIDRAVFVMNSAKHRVFKMPEFFILRCLLPARNPKDRPENSQEDEAMFGDDALDLLLGKDSAGVIVRNLISFVLRGSTTEQAGRKAAKADSVRAYALAVSIFEQFHALHPTLEALNPDHIPLSKIQQDLAPQICLAIKMHYKKLPTTIVDKMKKLGFELSTIPSCSAEEEEEPQEDENGEEYQDEEEISKKSEKIVFEAGHIKTWWDEMLRLPYDQRPRFCISAKLGDSFVDISEEALLAILWGESSGDVGRTMEAKVRRRTEAKVDQRSDYGRLMRRLFIGIPEDLVNKEVRQTTYGKRTTTMQELSTQHPQIYGQGSLARYTIQRINVLREIYNQNLTTPRQPVATTSTSSPPSAPQLPALPSPTSSMVTSKRYALSNYLRTDGHQCQLLAFDVRRGRESSSYKEFLHRIETDFPTRQSIVDWFGDDMSSVVVVGVDPGERVSATFCVRLGEDSAVNLLVKRSALYQPTLAYRRWLQDLKGAQPAADQGDRINGDVWAVRDPSSPTKTTVLPNMFEIEQTLQPTSYASQEDMMEAHEKYLATEPLLHEFYGSRYVKFASYEHRKSRLSELDLAVAGVMKLVGAAVARIPAGKTPKVVFAWGNGSFRSGCNLTSQHMTLQRRLAQKARERGYLVMLVDEYLTSTMCPTCVAAGVSTRLAKPSMRVCACLECQRWIHRDVVGAHTMVLVGEQYVRTLGRPKPLQRPV